MLMSRTLSLSLLLLLATTASWAESELQYNQVRFQVRAAETIANDRMRAVMVAQDEDSDAARLADRINKAMNWALQQARGESKIQIQSGSYTTQPIYKKDTIDGWRARQELLLTSGDFGKLGTMIGTLQQKLQLQTVDFSVADETREAVERRLIDQALDAFKQRAEQVRKNMGTANYRIVELNINTEGSPVQPVPMMRAEAMTMSKSVAQPGFEGGESELAVSVHGTIQLH